MIKHEKSFNQESVFIEAFLKAIIKNDISDQDQKRLLKLFISAGSGRATQFLETGYSEIKEQFEDEELQMIAVEHDSDFVSFLIHVGGKMPSKEVLLAHAKRYSLQDTIIEASRVGKRVPDEVIAVNLSHEKIFPTHLINTYEIYKIPISDDLVNYILDLAPVSIVPMMKDNSHIEIKMDQVIDAAKSGRIGYGRIHDFLDQVKSKFGEVSEELLIDLITINNPTNKIYSEVEQGFLKYREIDSWARQYDLSLLSDRVRKTARPFLLSQNGDTRDN